MPWTLSAPLRARYPALARRLGVEGVAVVDFEINAQGGAKTIQCVEAWPSDVFYAAAREALERARFEPREDQHVRFGASYRMPFVFRIAGAAGR
jgi:TonB family protein